MIDAMIATLLPLAVDRDWQVQQPSRSVHAAPVRAASTIPSSMRAFAACVSDRESGGSYSARNTSGSTAQGRWQFLDRQWRVNGGLHFMVSKRLKRFGMPASAASDVRQFLKSTPIYRWPAAYQDTAFIAVVEAGGWRHWSGHSCNGLAP